MSVIVDSTLTSAFIIGSIIALVSTFGTIFIQNYVVTKGKDKDRTFEQTERIKAEVYSPMLFFLFEIADSIAKVTGNIKGFCQIDPSKKEFQDKLILKFKEELDHFKCNRIKELLLNRIAFIEPTEFRRQLFFYLQTLTLYEEKLRQFCEMGFFEGYLKQDIEFLKNFEAASFELMRKTQLFEACFSTLTHKRMEGIKNFNIFDKEDIKKLNLLISSRNSIMAKVYDSVNKVDKQ